MSGTEKGMNDQKNGQPESPANDQENMKNTHETVDTAGIPPENQAGMQGQEQAGNIQENETDKSAELIKENAEMKDRLLRTLAEFENFKKRVTREKEESIKYANSMLLLDIANVIDNFERALKSAEESNDFAAFHSGVALIEKEMTTMLETKYGLLRFNAKGSVYDPQKHEALMSEESKEIKEPTVLEDFQSGYTLHGRVLRPAKVKVGQPAG
ncbi:MAG: nucleotide exchange factor GrpE [Spirochaetales bacterium]|nr:nucleotide exchange factor GrpE [Spirochaetales bacterium]